MIPNVKFRKVVQRSIREVRDGISVSADVNAVVAVNVDEEEARTKATGGTRSRDGHGDDPGTCTPRTEERRRNG